MPRRRLGNLRWRAPQAPASWHGVRPAFAFGRACPQTASKDIPLGDMSEDCLTLNVWSPARRGGAKLPVMVWLHGGAFENGSARMAIYDGANIAQRGVVIVSLNYRLGFLGFFGHPELEEEAKAEGVPTANYGLLDQIAALQMGAGQHRSLRRRSRQRHAVRQIRGRHQRAGAHDGALRARAVPQGHRPKRRRALDRAFARSEQRQVPVRPPDRREGRQRLRAAAGQGHRGPARQKLAGHPGEAPPGRSQDHTPFLDGQLLTGQMEQVFERGEQAPVPLIVGANSYEGVLLRKALHVSEKEVGRAAGSQLDELSAMYPPQLIMTDGFLADHIWGDAHFVEPARMIARAAAHKGVPVYHYSFDFQPPLLRLLGGSPHGLEVAYALGTLRKIVPFPLNVLMHPHNYTVSRLMMTYWTNFAKTGNPNGGGELEWPRFTEATRRRWFSAMPACRSSATTSRNGSTCSRLSSGEPAQRLARYWARHPDESYCSRLLGLASPLRRRV